MQKGRKEGRGTEEGSNRRHLLPLTNQKEEKELLSFYLKGKKGERKDHSRRILHNQREEVLKFYYFSGREGRLKRK